MIELSAISDRSIDERAYLYETNLDLAADVVYLLSIEMLRPQGTRQNIDVSIQKAARLALDQPDYGKKAAHIETAVRNAQIHYPSLEIPEMVSPDTPLTNKRISAWENSLYNKTASLLLQASGWEVLPLSEKDVPPFIELSATIDKISCYEFALMRAGVEDAFPLNWETADLLSLFPEWGFVPISKEQSRPGDLVVFLKSGEPLHMGIRYKDQILSKPGNEQPFAVVHKLEEAEASYGDQVVFFRRKLLA